jgi:type II secretory pathway component GspD/PulD (secretin)
MVRLHCIVLALLAAAGCVTVPAERPRSDLEREVDQAFAQSDEPWKNASGGRTGNVTLVVEKVSVARSDLAQLESAWRYADERVAAAGGALAQRNGLRVGIALDGFAAALQAALQKTSTQKIEKAMITSLSGTSGVITVGQDIHVQSLRIRGAGSPFTLLGQSSVSASLVATPTILPDDMVRIQLHPQFTERDGQYFDLASVETDVVVANGQSVVIGGLDQSSDDVGAALFSLQQGRQERRVLLTVTPHIHGVP